VTRAELVIKYALWVFSVCLTYLSLQLHFGFDIQHESLTAQSVRRDFVVPFSDAAYLCGLPVLALFAELVHPLFFGLAVF
jgi:hypothetical protein